jgi:hypothetical protein
MNTRTPLILGALCVAVLAFILLYEKDMKPSDQVRTEAKRLFADMDTEAVARISLSSEDADITMEKGGNLWKVVKPVKTSADPSEIEMLLSEMQYLERVQRFDIEGTEDQLKEYGLFKPRMTFRAKAGKEQFELRLGRDTPGGDRVYAQTRKGGKTVVILEKAIAEKLLRPVEAWRDKRVQPIDQPAVREVALQGKGLDMSIARSDPGWHLARPINARASGEAVNNFFSALAGGRVTKFVAEDSSNLAEFGLNEPFRITLTRSEGEPIVVEIGAALKNDPSQSYARSSHLGKSVFTIPATLMTSLMPSVDALRDKRIARWAQEEVTRVRVRMGKETVEASRDSGEWRLGVSGTLSADAAAVEQFLSKLAALDATRYVADAPTTLKPYGLDEPAWRVELFRSPKQAKGKADAKEKAQEIKPPAGSENGEVWLALDFGRVEKNEIFVRSSIEPFISAVPLQQVGFLPVQAWDWKAKRANLAEAASLKKITIKEGKSAWEIVKGDKGWESVGNALDAQGLSGLVGQITALRPTKWLGPKPPLPASLPTLTFSFGGEPARELRVWARKSGEDALAFFAGVDEDYFDIASADLELIRAALRPTNAPVTAVTPAVTAEPKPSTTPEKRR